MLRVCSSPEERLFSTFSSGWKREQATKEAPGQGEVPPSGRPAGPGGRALLQGLGMLKKFPAREPELGGPGQSATGTRAETDILAVGQQSHQLYLREIVGQG